jgi:hypothetical protein
VGERHPQEKWGGFNAGLMPVPDTDCGSIGEAFAVGANDSLS